VVAMIIPEIGGRSTGMPDIILQLFYKRDAGRRSVHINSVSSLKSSVQPAGINILFDGYSPLTGNMMIIQNLSVHHDAGAAAAKVAVRLHLGANLTQMAEHSPRIDKDKMALFSGLLQRPGRALGNPACLFRHKGSVY